MNAKSGHASCTLKSVDIDSVACTRGKDLNFQRADILTIKIPRRSSSALIGAAIGGGAGAGIGLAASGGSCKQLCIVSRGDVIAVGGLGGALAWAITGGLADFAKSTVYKAP